MIKNLTILILCLASFTATAQYDGKGENEVSRFRPGFIWYFTGLKPAKVEKVRKYDRLIFDVTYNDWIGDRDLFQNHWSSIGLNTNFMFDIPLSKGNTVSLGLGVSHEFKVIRHNGLLIEDELAGTTIWQEKSAIDKFNKGIFGGNSFTIPVELRFRKESWRHFKFHLGGKVGYQVNAYSKYITGHGSTRDVEKDYGFSDLNGLIYSAHVRLGLRNWALFGSYNFNTIFSNSSSTKLNHVQMGLSVSLF
ncbi:MAG: hypothetical protein P8M19_03240 [Crocinitomicaceae bacterium]|nr:hypothetical protein [Crocinitomicaceae bacterium]MDG1659069.1 hypothetical protein [Crocinitomicaceae bacterium]MDG2440662.1 hypothetical protein [Crocinitomicaceae bacterium]